MPDTNPSEETRQVTIDGELSGDLAGSFQATVTLTPTGDDHGPDSVSGDAPPAWLSEVAWFYTAPPDPVTEADADVVVASKPAFVDAVTNADAEDVVWVDPDSRIDLSGERKLGVGADGVTVASNRCIPAGDRGGTIVVEDYPGNVFKTKRDGLRFTGLHVQGPIPGTFVETYDEDKLASFGLFYGDGCEFDNCEFHGWPFAGLALGAKNYPVSHEVHHCDFHDNLMQGLGYGMELYNGYHSIHHCYFNRNRHDISGFGRSTNGYEAYRNVSGPAPFYHAFDMHALTENVNQGGDLAGGRIEVRENLFMFSESFTGYPQEAVNIRGVPEDNCTVAGNYFRHDSEPDPPGESGSAYRQKRVDDWTNFEARDNQFGTDLALYPPVAARVSLPYEVTIASTDRTPAMQYSFRVDGTVREVRSLEDADRITETDDGHEVTGSVGPSGADTYAVDGPVTAFDAVDIDTGEPVEAAQFELRVDGTPFDLRDLVTSGTPDFARR